MKKEKKYNYTYCLHYVLDDRYYYYGVRSTDIEPSIDNYMGSGKQLDILSRDNFKKEILCIFSTRLDALKEEEKLIGDLWKSDPFCLNRSPGGQKGGKFDGTGMIWITKDNQMRLIDPDELKKFEDNGWKKGITEEKKEKARLGSLGQHRKPGVSEKIRKTKEERGLFKVSDEVKKKISLGNRGKIHSQEQNERNSEIHKGRVWMKKDNIEKQVIPEEVDNMLKNGWVRGRLGFSEEMKKKSSEATKKKWLDVDYRRRNVNTRIGKKHTPEHIEKLREIGKSRYPYWNVGTVYVRKNDIEKRIKKEELEKYLEDGWIKGRNKYKRNVGK